MIITLEGVDRSGKSTQAAMLAEWAGRLYETRFFKFPDYSTPVDRLIHEYLTSGNADPVTLHTLMAENRRERLADIRRSMSDARVIIMDRYAESNIAYGLANGLDREWLAGLDRGMPESDAVILLDVDVSESIGRRSDADAFESDHALIARAAESYRQEARSNGWFVVPAGLSVHDARHAVLRFAAAAINGDRA